MVLEEARRRKKKVTWNETELEQEVLWRSWFPKLEADWSKTFDDATADIFYDACTAFIEANVMIKTPRGKIPFKLREAQKDVLWKWIQNRRSIALKARQVGFSTLAGAYALWLTFGWPDRLIVMLSKGERESISLLRKAKDAYKNMPDWVRFRGPQLVDRVAQRLTFDNDSSIWSLPSASDPARGETVFAVFVDEWAFLPNAEEAWSSIEPITDIGGRVYGISTANGEGDFFHNMWLGSQSQTNSFIGIFHPWSAVDERDAAWYEEKKRDMMPWQLAQEYPSTPEEAFVGSGNPVFNLNILRSCVPLNPIDVFDIFSDGKGRFKQQDGKCFSVWEQPNEQDKFSYVVGADVAEGLEHGDYSVATVICVQTGRMVAAWHGHCDPDVFGENILPAIGWMYRYAVIAPEVNNHGLTVLKGLQRAGYGRLYRRRTFAKRQDKALDTMGWLTTHTSKPLLVDELAAWLREPGQNVPSAPTIAELRGFSRDANGKMGGRPHDDRVMSLGIAVQCRKYAIIEHVQPGVEAKRIPGTFAWWEAKLDGVSKKRTKVRPNFG